MLTPTQVTAENLIALVLHEARLLDAHDHDAWNRLFADEAYYWVWSRDLGTVIEFNDQGPVELLRWDVIANTLASLELWIGAVVGVGVLGTTIGVMGGGGAEEIKVDAVHGFRPGCGMSFWNAMDRGIFRIRNFLETKAELTCRAGVICRLCPCCGPLMPPRAAGALPKRGGR